MQEARDWFITNINPGDMPQRKDFFTNMEGPPAGSGEFTVAVYGYIVPRNRFLEELKDYSPEDMVRKLYRRSGESFINYIKGNFIVIILFENEFLIFSDRAAMKKYFIYRDGDRFFISNSLGMVYSRCPMEADWNNAAIFTLFSHFPDNLTIFRNVNTNRAGEVLFYKEGMHGNRIYWSPAELLEKREQVRKPRDFYSSGWLNIINSYLQYLKPEKTTLTVTGGNDSRMVLAALLRSSVPLRGFTYGDPESHDGVISGMISRKCLLEHENYFVEDPRSEWFGKTADKLIEKGNSLINIHRAHRYTASEEESLKMPENSMIFTGLLGGETLKEPRYDNKVIPSLIRELLQLRDKDKAKSIIIVQLRSRGVNISMTDPEVIYRRIKSFADKGRKLGRRERKFVYMWYYYGSSHHSQDTNIFGLHFKYVVNPFMDIDYLEMLSGYNKWYLNRKQDLSGRLFHSELHAAVTDALAPELSGIPYAKKGEYAARELLGNKAVYLLKRIARYLRRNKRTYPPNFPMGEWLYDFVRERIEKTAGEPAEFFNTGFLRKKLEQMKGRKTEESWHVLTDPVNLFMIYEKYVKAQARNPR